MTNIQNNTPSSENAAATKADFFIFIVSDLTPDEADHVAAIAFEAGASGTEERLPFEQKSREYEPVTLVPDITEIKIYFETPPPQDFAENLKAQFPEARVTLSQESNRDWLAEWKKGFEPFCLAGETWIVPSWCETPKAAKKVIRIDPGMAFGTGTHETTRLAAGFLQDFIKPASATSLADIGTGTGILAIQAEILGVRDLIANDIDPEARRVARENVELNDSRVKIVDEDLEHITGHYDWVVANIIDGVLVKLQSDLRERVAAGGYLLLTGILQERDELFRSEFIFTGFQLIERRQLGEWVGYLLKRE